MIAWNSDDAVKLRTFLKDCPHFIPCLKGMAPKITGKTIEEKAMSGSIREGADKMVEAIEDYMTSETSLDEKSPFV